MVEMENFIDSWLKAWSEFDQDKLMSFYHQQMTYRDPSLGSDIGSGDFEQYVGKMRKKFFGWRWSRVELFGEGNLYCLKWKAVFPQDKEVLGLDLIEFKDNKILRNEVYFDLTKIL